MSSDFHCNKCGVVREHKELAQSKQNLSDHDIEFHLSHTVASCVYCEEVIFVKEIYNSEISDTYYDGETGEVLGEDDGIRYTFFPARVERPKPSWIDKLGDRILIKIINDAYLALDNQSNYLAVMGLRTALDRMFFLKVGDCGRFDEKVDRMVAEGHLSVPSSKSLEVIINAGNAAAHRGWFPDNETAFKIFTIAENIIKGALYINKLSNDVGEEVPPRPKPTKEGVKNLSQSESALDAANYN